MPSRGAERLLRLYPRAWRERYGEEFLATLGGERLHLQLVIDVVSGAIDAWLSPDVRNALEIEGASTNRGGSTMLRLAMCHDSKVRFTTREALLGAAVLIGTSALLAAAAFATRMQGWQVATDVLLMLSFPGSVVISMPFTFLKGQPWRAQAAIVGGLLLVLIGIAGVSSRLAG